MQACLRKLPLLFPLQQYWAVFQEWVCEVNRTRQEQGSTVNSRSTLRPRLQLWPWAISYWRRQGHHLPSHLPCSSCWLKVSFVMQWDLFCVVFVRKLSLDSDCLWNNFERICKQNLLDRFCDNTSMCILYTIPYYIQTIYIAREHLCSRTKEEFVFILQHLQPEL